MPHVRINSWQALIRPPAPGVKPPEIPDVSLQALACRRSVVSVTALITSSMKLDNCQLKVSDLVRGNFHIPASYIHTRMVVSTNVAGQGAVSDKLLKSDIFSVNVSLPIVITIEVPTEIPAGVYEGKVSLVSEDQVLAEKNLLLEVADVVLPEASDREFSLNACLDIDKIAKAHNCSKWSDEHFEYLTKYAKTLSILGQRAIPVTDPYELVRREQDQVDLTLFKKFLGTFHQAGMGDYIYLFNMVTSTGTDVDPDSKLVTTLKAISKDIGLACITLPIYVVISEKSKLRAAAIMDYVRANTPEFKVLNIEHAEGVSLCRAEHVSTTLQFAKGKVAMDDEVESNIKEIASILAGSGEEEPQPESELKLCHVEGLPDYPGMFIHSPLVETRMLPFLAAQVACDGLSLFSYNDWPDADAGVEFGRKENFLVYPSEEGPAVSMRWLQLLEGIQDYELAMIALRRISTTEEMIDYQQALSLACRDLNGAMKSTGDIEIARRLLMPIASHSRQKSTEGTE